MDDPRIAPEGVSQSEHDKWLAMPAGKAAVAEYTPLKALRLPPSGVCMAEHVNWLVPNASAELEKVLSTHVAHGTADGFDQPEAARLYKRLQRFFGGKSPEDV